MHILHIQIATPVRVWDRCLIVPQVPATEELEFYYRTLCDIQDAVITLKEYDVPDTFNATLLTNLEKAPNAFPVHDLATHPDEIEKRTAYARFLEQARDMEVSRAALNVFAASTSPSEDASTDASPKTAGGHVLRIRAWVRDLLQALNAENDIDENAIVEYVNDTTVPLGWVITPVAAARRSMMGSRIVLSPEIGKKWERLLGTDLYPDMVVSRRISSANWMFQHVTSDALIKATLEWYLAAQSVSMNDGITGWIVDADRELNMLFNTFRRIKINEKFIMEALPRQDKTNQVFTLISNVEKDLLESALENPIIQAIPHDIFQRYMTYVFRAFNVPKELYHGVEAVNIIYQRWGRGNMGFKPESVPLVESWRETWNHIMRGTPNVQRVQIFLRTLDSWDPLEAMNFNKDTKADIANEWLNIFLDTMMVEDVDGRIRTTNLHDQAREWCRRFLPVSTFPTQFTPMAIGPVLTRRGFASVKTKDGRWVRGLRYKDPDMEKTLTPEKPTKTKVQSTVITTTTETEEGAKVATMAAATVTHNENHIEHFFSSHEVHLGNV